MKNRINWIEKSVVLRKLLYHLYEKLQLIDLINFHLQGTYCVIKNFFR